MAIIKRSPTVGIQNNWNQVVPAQSLADIPLNVDEDPFAANTTDYLGTTFEARTYELGGFDFSAIPPGSTINRITVRKFKEAGFDPFPDEGGVCETLDLRVSGVVRHSTKWFVDTTDENEIIQQRVIAMDYLTPNITRDELATPGAFTFRSLANHSQAGSPGEPPRFDG